MPTSSTFSTSHLNGSAPDLGRPVANVGELVARSARLHAHQLAVTSDARSVTYEQLNRRANQLANALLALGLQRGDRVGIYLANCVEIVEIELACYKAGLIKAPFNARLSPREVGDITANSDAALIVTTAARAEQIRPHLPNAALPLILIDSDGSERTAKGVTAATAPKTITAPKKVSTI